MARADGGGVPAPSDSGGTTTSDGTYEDVPFGARDLSLGMSGDDVKTLNWLMNALAGSGPIDANFDQPTDSLVREFQSKTGLQSDGVVRKDTRKTIASRMPNQAATWYGRGLWGHQTACRKTLKPTTIGVAHRKLPCGTRVTFAYAGHWVRAKVIDRGPFRKGYKWDLTKKLAKRLGFLADSSGDVKAAIVR